jgi:sugar phosphate isomerase/epimerase
MYRHLPFAEACREIKKAGCSGIDVWSSPRMCEHVHPQSSAAEIKRIVSDNGLAGAPGATFSIPKVARFAPVALTAYHTLSPAEAIGRFIWSIEFAAELGAGCVVTNAVDWKGDRASFLRHLGPALKVAEARNVRIAFENHSSQSFSATQDDLLAISREIDAPCFGFTIAPPHLVIRGSDVAETIRRLGRRVFFFYAWDHIPGVDDDGRQFIWPPPYPEHHFPGQGRLDFPSYIKALSDVGYEEAAGGWINIRSYPGYCARPWTTERITAELKGAVKFLSGE